MPLIRTFQIYIDTITTNQVQPVDLIESRLDAKFRLSSDIYSFSGDSVLNTFSLVSFVSSTPVTAVDYSSSFRLISENLSEPTFSLPGLVIRFSAESISVSPLQPRFRFVCDSISLSPIQPLFRLTSTVSQS